MYKDTNNSEEQGLIREAIKVENEEIESVASSVSINAINPQPSGSRGIVGSHDADRFGKGTTLDVSICLI